MPRFIENFLNFAGNFFYLLFGCSWAKSESFLRGQSLQPMLITVISFWPEGHQEHCEKVGSLSLAEHLVRLKQRTFLFNWNALAH